MKKLLFGVILVLSGLLVITNKSYACDDPPVADLSINPQSVMVDVNATLDGSNSYDNDGSITKYEWDFTNDGSYDYSETASVYTDGAFDGITTHSYSTGGAYTVKLRVTDNDNLTSTDTYVVYVGGAKNITQVKYYHTIQLALNDANDNDVIELMEDIYYETVDFNGVNCTLRSTDPNDPDVVAATIIDANSSGNAVTFETSENANAVLTGVTITGGTYGIDCNNASPTVTKCVLKDNSTGIYCTSANTVSITNCIIYDNSIGILFDQATNPTVSNNTIVDNTNYGIYGPNSLAVTNCILWNNNDDLYGCSPTYCCIEDNDSGTGNINNDPCFVDANLNNFQIWPHSGCIDAADGNMASATDILGEGRIDVVDMTNTGVGDPNYTDIGAYENQLGKYSTFGMEVNSVTQDANGITITTTGARYVLSVSGMEMWRKIDPKTNDVNERQVASLSFDPNISSLSIELDRDYMAIIDSDKLAFKFYSDSWFTVTAKSDINCTHTNLIADAPWNAPLDVNDRDLDRMWTDGYGGSLLAHLSEDTNGLVISEDINSTTVSLTAGEETAHMVFPPKPYDFEGLYGTGKRPFVNLMSSITVPKFINDTDGYRQSLIDNDFGICLLFPNRVCDNNGLPMPLDADPNIIGYQMDPNYVSEVNDLITTAHANDFNVLFYCTYPSRLVWNGQDLAITLQFLREFQEEYNFDGWYFDNADTGDLIDDYEFMRQVRTDVGDDGIIYHHDSVDVWSMTGSATTGYKGLRAIMVDTYVNYTLTGETGDIAKINDPNDPYFRFFSAGYGMSQTYAAHKRRSDMKFALSARETRRLMGQNLNGCEDNLYYAGWSSHFKPAYDIRKAEYAGSNFDPDVDWPLDGSSSDPNLNWFRTPDFDPTDSNDLSWDSSSATIHWVTDANSDSKVAYTDNGVWWRSATVDINSVTDSNMLTDHTITLDGLNSNTFYEFKIRSNNGDANIPGEIIWGYVGDFTTD